MKKSENGNPEVVVTSEVVMSDFDRLVQGIKDKTIGILTICENVKPCSFQHIQTAIYAPIPGEVYDPNAVNTDALRKVLIKKGVNVDGDFLKGWKMPERKVNTFKGTAWAIGDTLKAPKSSGKQSPDAVYRVEWVNDSYILIVPISGQAKDAEGYIIDAPRCMSKTALATLEPVKVEVA